MKILVTGPHSFVGKVLMPLLQQSGHEVYGVSRTGDHFQRFLSGDLSKSSTYQSLPDDINAVVHLAAVTSPPNCSANDLFLNNTESTRLLVDFSKKIGVEKFIYASSISVYGDIQSPVLEESTPIINPSSYGVSKLGGEMFLREAENDFASFSLRLPAIIGKGATRHWLATVYQKILDNEEVEIYNSTFGFNNCIHVENLCAFILELLNTKKTGSHVMNLGCADGISIDECVFYMANLLKTEVRPKYIDSDKPSFTVKIDQAIENGFEPWSVKQSLECWIH